MVKVPRMCQIYLNNTAVTHTIICHLLQFSFTIFMSLFLFFQIFAVSLVKQVKPRSMTVSPDTHNWFWFRKCIARFHWNCSWNPFLFQRMDRTLRVTTEHLVSYWVHILPNLNCKWCVTVVRYVKEQLTDDSAHPPCSDGQVVCWVWLMCYVVQTEIYISYTAVHILTNFVTIFLNVLMFVDV